MGLRYKHFEAIEKRAGLLGVLIAVMVSLGGLAEITPLLIRAHSVEPPTDVQPYDALRLAGKDVYVREGCYLCHSQMIRPMRDEVERYGHYSLAAESQYDHPFQWGSKRTGPDLARVGGRYSDEWHVAHLVDPQSVVPESIMPKYGFLQTTMIEPTYIQDLLRTNRTVGVPYSDEMIASARADFLVQADPDGDHSGLLARYPGAQARNFDGRPGISEMDALISYMQMLGTLVDFSTFTPDASR